MLLDEFITVKINAQTIKYWQDLGYSIPTHKDSKGRIKTFKKGVTTIYVSVKDLPIKSNVRVKVKCDICGLERRVSFSTYSDVCWECNLSSQKGVKHPRYLHRVKTGGADRAFDLYLQRAYGITSDQYYTILKDQEYKCAICQVRQANEGRKFALDHCHKTNKVRGILCQPCNTAIGLLKENEDAISKIIPYLKKAA